MPFEDTTDFREPESDKGFQTTHWSVVLAATQSETSHAEEALAKLCGAYWRPLYAYIRRRGYNTEDAQDLTQEFFARLLGRGFLRLADRSRGRFRSFLLKSLQHFLVNDWVRRQAQKRGGGTRVLSLDEQEAERCYLNHPADQLTPDSLYDRSWAMTLLERAMAQLGENYAAAGKRDLFEHLKSLLLVEGTEASYRCLAGRLGLSEGAAKVAVHRLRRRFRDTLRAEIAQTVDSPEAVDEELRCLMAAMSG